MSDKPQSNPAVVGLAGFGGTTLLLQFHNLGLCACYKGGEAFEPAARQYYTRRYRYEIGRGRLVHTERSAMLLICYLGV